MLLSEAFVVSILVKSVLDSEADFFVVFEL